MRITSVPSREVEIGKRLREFREFLTIARTAFALKIGIGPERLASYEAGRAPLPYSVFKSLSDQTRINPHWLATGETSIGPMPLPLDDKPFREHISPRSLFSEIYDKHIKTTYEQEQYETIIFMSAAERGIHKLRNTLTQRVARQLATLTPVSGFHLLLQEICALLDQLEKYNAFPESYRAVLKRTPAKK